MENKLKLLVELGDNDILMLGSIMKCLHKLPEEQLQEIQEVSEIQWSTLRLTLLTLKVDNAKEFIEELFRINDPKRANNEEERHFFEQERKKLIKIFGDRY